MILAVISVLTYIMLLARMSKASTAIAPPRHVKGHEGKCWDEHEQLELNPGESRTLHTWCTLIVCNNDLSMNYQSCGLLSSECGEQSDLTKDYPYCCPMPKECP